MMSKEYAVSHTSISSNLPETYDLLWSNSEISDVEQSLEKLQQGKQLTTMELDYTTLLVKRGLDHPTFTRTSRTILEKLYNQTRSAKGQAHIIGNLLEPANINIIKGLLDNPGNPLRERLGSQGVENIIEVARINNPISRTRKLLHLASSEYELKGVLVSNEQYENEAESEPEEDKMDGGDGSNTSTNLTLNSETTASDEQVWKFIDALQNGDVGTLQSIISQTEDLTLLAESSIELGDDIRPVLQEIAVINDERANQFAFQVLQFLATNDLEEQRIAQGMQSESSDLNRQQFENGFIDVAALENLLTNPEGLPANLATHLGGAPSVQAALLELIVK